MTENKKTLIVSIIITGLCAIIYAQTTGFDFINIDDRAYIWENRAVQSGLNSQSIAWAFTSFYSANWHPLTWLSHMFDSEIFGPWAGGHHLTNAILHTINSLLVFFVFRRMTGAMWRPAFVAALFAVHPAHVESVAWIAERKDVLSTMFWVLTMLAYARYSSPDKEAGPAAWLRMWPVIVLFALGLMSKPMLVTLPFVLLLCDYWPLGRLKNLDDLRRLTIEKVPLFVLAAASSVITLIAQSSAGATASLGSVPLGTRIGNVIVSYGRYLRMLVYPFDLGIWYPLDTSINGAAVIGSAVILLLVTFFIWRYRHGPEYLVTGGLWFLGTLVPVIGLVQVGMQSHADRYTYIPYIGLFVMLVWGITDLSKRFNLDIRIPAVVGTIVVVLLTAAAYRQTSLWRDSESLYTHTLGFTENNQFLLSNLCLYYVAKADAVTADKRCTDLLRQMPPSADGLQILGYLKIQTGKYDEAVRLLQDAERANPASGQTLLQLSQALALRGSTGEAEQTLLRAVKMNDAGMNPEILARTSVAVADGYAKSGRREKAAEYYQRALGVRPNMPEARIGLERLEIK